MSLDKYLSWQQYLSIFVLFITTDKSILTVSAEQVHSIIQIPVAALVSIIFSPGMRLSSTPEAAIHRWLFRIFFFVLFFYSKSKVLFDTFKCIFDTLTLIIYRNVFFDI